MWKRSGKPTLKLRKAISHGIQILAEYLSCIAMLRVNVVVLANIRSEEMAATKNEDEEYLNHRGDTYELLETRSISSFESLSSSDRNSFQGRGGEIEGGLGVVGVEL